MARVLSLVSLFLLSAANLAHAKPCIAFDAKFNLLALGLNGKDWSAGTQEQWAAGKPTDITTTGRPPFDGPSPTCYMAQFFNTIYVLGADAANPASVYIYDATAKSWSTQSVTAGTFDPSSFDAVLDHDTNIFYALSKGELFSLDMGALVKANSTALSWIDQKKAGFTTDNYKPIMGLASNHIHFLNVPGTAAGSANIFVIHFSYFQPEVQALGDFPAQNGQAASIFLTEGAQNEFAYVPDDGSATYIVNVKSNTTQTLAGPTTKDADASYFAGITSLVQLSSAGAVSYLPYTPGDASASKAATWSPVGAFAAIPAASPSSSSASGSGKPTSGTGTGTSPASSATSGTGNGAIGTHSIGFGVVLASVLTAAAFLL